jgi:hypothetical protein
MSDSPKLFERIHATFRLEHFSLKTEKSYLYYIKDFLRDRQVRHPYDLRVEEIEEHVAIPALNSALSASRFLYRKDLRMRKIDLSSAGSKQRYW